MDEMKIKTPFMKKILNEIIKKAVKKKLGCDVDVSISDLVIKNNGDTVFLSIDFAAQCPTDNILKILKNTGLL